MRHPVYLGGEGGAEAAAGGRAGPELGRRDEGLAIRPEGPGPGSGPMAPLSREPLARGGRAAAPTFYVAGFWRRLAHPAQTTTGAGGVRPAKAAIWA